MSAAAIPPGQERGAELPRPVLQAMLVCENAIRETQTNKVTLVGIFDRMGSNGFPLVWGHPVYVYARITDAQGDYPIRLELVRLDDEQAVGLLEGRAEFADRVASSELIFPLPGLTFDKPGRYEFRLFADGRWVIGGIILTVVQIGQTQGGPQ